MSIPTRIEVTAAPQYLGVQSGSHAFAYTIRIRNLGPQAATLRARHWIINHSDGTHAEVQGSGVVGETPRLSPGEDFTYTSGAVIPTTTGSMRGHYAFETDGGEHFTVEIPEFALVAPGRLN